jgi:DNA polymerase-3 subunit gamma/tau
MPFMKSSAKKEVHTALYRKYRPETFKDVIGQDHVVSVLEATIKNKSIAHAYLFAGSRGTGKTSVARIVAREIGCSANDLYEIDAASNRGIDDVREIKESVSTLPFESPYKVYIIDEVHMLTKEAFNALLKTLEEPPAYVVFILATTEIEKIPETVLSRCQVFQFKKPSETMLKDVVLTVAKKEGFAIGTAAAELIALLGDGSFRDTQGTLQKVLGLSDDKKITLEEVEKITGAPRNFLINNFVEAISRRGLDTALETLGKITEGNTDVKMFLKLVLMKMRYVLLLKYAKEMEKVIKEKVSSDDFILISKLAGEKDSGINSIILYELLGAYDMVGRTQIPELPIELALVKTLSTNNPQPTTNS